jgi:2-keto-4-pentenoate hydratase
VTSDAGAADLISQCAAVLYGAESSRRPIQPLTSKFPQLTVPEAYRIQQANVERRLKRGEHVVGHKIGLTARAMQEMFGVNEPDYGHLLDTMLHDERVPLDLGTLIDPQIEIEPAFVLGSRLQGPAVGVADVLAATEYVCVCFEVIDSRIIDWRVRLQDTVADNGSSARVVLGAFKADPNTLDLDNLDTELELDGVVRETGNTSAILGHPANGIAWLANRISEFGLTLEAGHVVLPGTCTRCVRIGGHARVAGRIEGLGEVTLQLVGAPSVPNRQAADGS